MNFINKMILFSLALILVISCKEDIRFPYQILNDHRESFIFKIADIDSIYYFPEYPDTMSIYEYSENIAEDVLLKHNWKLESNLYSNKKYSMFILFKDGEKKIVEYTSGNKCSIQFVIHCDFVKFYNGDELSIIRKNTNDFCEYFIRLNSKNHPYYDCFNFDQIESIDSLAIVK